MKRRRNPGGDNTLAWVLGLGVFGFFAYKQGWLKLGASALPVIYQSPTAAPSTAPSAGMQWSWNGSAWVATAAGNI